MEQNIQEQAVEVLRRVLGPYVGKTVRGTRRARAWGAATKTDFTDLLLPALRSPGRKRLPTILAEATSMGIRERELPWAYFDNLLHKEGTPDHRNFLGRKGLAAVKSAYPLPAAPEVLLPDGTENTTHDKARFAEALQQWGLAGPRHLGTYLAGVLKTEDGDVQIATPTQLKKQLDALLATTGVSALFVKRSLGSHASDVFRYTGDQEMADEIFAIGAQKLFVIQEMIAPHPTLARVYPDSINALRVITAKTERGAEPIAALVRFASGGESIDNAAYGGIVVPVDLESWRLGEYGFTYPRHGGKWLRAHPDTGAVFVDLELPFQQEALALAIAAAERVHSPVVAWDIGLTSNGPVLIEGNAPFTLNSAQVATGGFRSSEGYRDVFASLNAKTARAFRR